MTTTNCWKEWPRPWHLHRSVPHRASSVRCSVPSPPFERALQRSRAIESIGPMTVWCTCLPYCNRLLHHAAGPRDVKACAAPPFFSFPRSLLNNISPAGQATCSRAVTKQLVIRQTERYVAVEPTVEVPPHLTGATSSDHARAPEGDMPADLVHASCQPARQIPRRRSVDLTSPRRRASFIARGAEPTGQVPAF